MKVRPTIATTAAAAALTVCGSAHAATITPDTKADEYGTGSACSLREAVASTNVNSDFGGCEASGDYAATDTIKLKRGRYELTRPGDESANVSGDLDVSGQTRIVGSRKRGARIDANGLDRALQFAAPSTIRRLEIVGGSTPFNGGGIFLNFGADLVVANSTIVGNTAGSTGNSFAGGGIATSLADLTIRSSTITFNRAANNGGGISFSANDGPTNFLTVTNSTITNNVANTGDHGVGGGGIWTGRAALRMRGSILAGNKARFGEAPDCQGFGTIASLGRNLIGNTAGCDFLTPGPKDIRNKKPKLGKLEDNGGPTRTHALKRESPAIDKGGKSCPKRDQRGVKRSKGGKRCDIGAYELVKKRRR